MASIYSFTDHLPHSPPASSSVILFYLPENLLQYVQTNTKLYSIPAPFTELGACKIHVLLSFFSQTLQPHRAGPLHLLPLLGTRALAGSPLTGVLLGSCARPAGWRSCAGCSHPLRPAFVSSHRAWSPEVQHSPVGHLFFLPWSVKPLRKGLCACSCSNPTARRRGDHITGTTHAE